jgi:hypothetical protein
MLLDVRWLKDWTRYHWLKKKMSTEAEEHTAGERGIITRRGSRAKSRVPIRYVCQVILWLAEVPGLSHPILGASRWPEMSKCDPQPSAGISSLLERSNLYSLNWHHFCVYKKNHYLFTTTSCITPYWLPCAESCDYFCKFLWLFSWFHIHPLMNNSRLTSLRRVLYHFCKSLWFHSWFHIHYPHE